jgi:hypothetical protein
LAISAPSPKPGLANTVDIAIGNALNLLEQTIQIQHSAISTHQVVVVTGWNASTAVRQAIAIYLVGLRVCAVNAALKIRAELTNTPTSRAEVVRNVEAIVGPNGAGLTVEQVERNRNPWIAEGLWHLCFALSQRVAAIHPPGKLIALNLPHAEATEHGIDVAAIYDTGSTFGLSIVETKAYPNHPNNAIHDAVGFFRKVDAEEFSLKIRQTIQRMRADLSANFQTRISPELWRQTRCYMPNPHYDASHAINWDNPRRSFKNLVPGPNGIFIMPHAAQGFVAYFNDIAAQMFTFARSL